MPQPITKHVGDHIGRQLQEHGLVVWYDPDQAFRTLYDALDLQATTKLAMNGSYFALREAAEPVTRAMRGGQGAGTRLLVYVPAAPLDRREDVLLPLTCLGGTVQLTLAEAARQALRDQVPGEALKEWLAIPGVTLDALEGMASAGSNVGPLGAVFGDVTPLELALALLREPGSAKTVNKNKLQAALADLLGRAFGVTLGTAAADAVATRDQFAKRVLVTEFLTDLDVVPSELQAIAIPAPAQVEACRKLADRLRSDRQLEEAYRQWANEAQREFALDDLTYDPEKIGRRDTFEFEERLALRHVAALARAGQWEPARAWVDERARSFWAHVDPERRGQWDAARYAVSLRIAADRLLAAIPAKPQSPTWWVEHYVDGVNGGEPACEVDTLLRRLNLRTVGAVDQPGLDELVSLARERAAEAEQSMAERFVDGVRQAGGFGNLPVQADVFHREVRPLLDAGRKVVLVLADALRYEMARDLEESLGRSGAARLAYALATPPTITKVGMAAYVPGAEQGLSLVPSAKGADPAVGSTTLAGLGERLARYRAAYGDRVSDMTLEDGLSLKAAQLQKRVKDADLLLLRVQDIDEIGELDNLVHARALLTGLVPNVQKAVQRLATAGAQEFVIVADHGYLLRDDINDSMKLDLPAGDVVESHRRCVIGRHLSTRPEYVVFRAAELGVGGEMELAFPRGINIFRTAGNMAYFHGGLSLQELVVPVLRYTPAGVAASGSLRIALEPKVGMVKTLVFQAVLSFGHGDQLELGASSRRFRLVAISESQIVGTTVMATEGLDETTGEVHLLPGQSSNLFIQLNDAVSGTGELELQLTDVASGETLTRKKLKYDLAF